MEKIKSCPFCGETPELKTNEVCQNWDDKGNYWCGEHMLQEQRIECNNTKCNVRPSLSRVNVQDAVEIWNTRMK